MGRLQEGGEADLIIFGDTSTSWLGLSLRYLPRDLLGGVLSKRMAC